MSDNKSIFYGGFSGAVNTGVAGGSLSYKYDGTSSAALKGDVGQLQSTMSFFRDEYGNVVVENDLSWLSDFGIGIHTPTGGFGISVKYSPPGDWDLIARYGPGASIQLGSFELGAKAGIYVGMDLDNAYEMSSLPDFIVRMQLEAHNQKYLMNGNIWTPEEAAHWIAAQKELDNLGPRCFSGSTLISTADGWRPISELRVGDQVWSFDASVEGGRGDLVLKRINNLFQNVTCEWVKLSWIENGQQRELVSTQGHHFLDRFGNFSIIEEMIENGEATVILANGEEARVKAERLVYSAETAHMFEQAQSVVPVSGNLALQPESVQGWQTYNFEVEDLHTYIAGGVRVHNDSYYTTIQSGDTLSEIALRNGTTVAALWAENEYIKDPDKIYAGNVLHITPGIRAANPSYGNGGHTYSIQSGDTLSEIAQRNGTTVSALMKANPLISDPNKIYAGSTLNITPSGSVTSSDNGNNSGNYQIQSGDTLSGIARRNGTTVRALLNSNRQITDPNKIRAGGFINFNPSSSKSGNGGSSRSNSTSTSSDSGGPYAGESWRDTSTGGTRAFNPSTRQYEDIGGSNAGQRSEDQSTGDSGGKPVLMDLDGDGVNITPLQSSNFFYDIDGDGQKNRTAWAAAGDGVLVRDAGDDGVIELKEEVDFTSWAPSAKSDLEALRAAFDTNNDDKLSAADSEWSLFKVLVTNADGTTTLKTLGELGITEIDLISNNQEITFEDGSKIVGSTTYTKSDGSTGIVGDVQLANEAAGYVVAETVTNNADGSTTIENVASRTDGTIAHKTTSTTSADGTSRTIDFDNDGDGILDRKQTEVRVVNGDGSVTKTLEDYDGSGTILTRRQVTDTSADGKTITVSRDIDGSGVNDQVETRVTGLDGSLTLTITNLNDDGTTSSEETAITSADGLSKTVTVDSTGDGIVNATRVVSILVAVDGTRTETKTDYAGDGVTTAHRIMTVVTVTNPDGSSRTVDSDLDGDGTTDISTISTILDNADGSRTTSNDVSNNDGSLRGKTSTLISADGKSETTSIDLDGDGVFDRISFDGTVENVDGSSTRSIIQSFANGQTASSTIQTWSADDKTRTTDIDSDGDGAVDRVQTVEIIGTDSVETNSVYSADGTTLLSRSVATTSADGLTQVTQSDVNGDGTFDTTQIVVKVINPDQSSTVTIENKNGDGTVVIGKTITTTSADGLTTTTEMYLNGATSPYESQTSVTVLNVDDSITHTLTTFAGVNQVQVSRVVSTTSADKLSQTIESFLGTNSVPHSVTTNITSTTGIVTQTEFTYSSDGATLLGKTITTISADGLTQTTTTGADGDGDIDGTSVAVKSLNSDGSTTTTATNYAGSGSGASDQIGRSVVTVSGNGLLVTSQNDANGNGVFDQKTIEETVLNSDGSRTKTATTFNGDGTIQTGKTISTISDNGLTTTTSYFVGTETTPYRLQTDTSVLGADGTTTTTTSLNSADNSLIARQITTQSGDGLNSTVIIDSNGDGVDDHVTTSTTNADGSVTSVISTYTAAGVLESRTTYIVSGDGLNATTATDLDGDGTTDKSSSEIVTLNTDGSRQTNASNFNADGSLRDRVIISISADGLTTTKVWKASDDSTTKTQTKTNVILADGSSTQTTTTLKADGSLQDEIVSTTSADGTDVETTIDIDGDGTIDQTIINSRHADGTTTAFSMEGTVQSASGREYGTEGGRYITTSADGLVSTTQYDADGDGLAETQTKVAVALNADGSNTRTVTRAELTGGDPAAAEPVYVETVKDITTILTSADGRTITTNWDADGDGVSESSSVVQSTLNADGSITNTTEFFEGVTLTSGVSTTTSADGQTVTTERNTDGSGTIDEVSTKTVSYEADGTVVEAVTNTDLSGTLISKTETTFSADGLTVTVERDPEGTGAFTESTTTETVNRADGSSIVTRSTYDGASLRDQSTTQTSADGYTTTIERDVDGDGHIDQIETITQFADGSSETIISEFDVSGTKISELTNQLSMDGLTLTSEKDEQGDGIIDQTTTHTWQNSADGSSTEVLKIYRVSEEASNGTFSTISPVLEREASITTSADGLSQTSTVDIDGDGTVDETTVAVEGIDGSIVTTQTANALAQSATADPDEIKWASTIASGSPIVAATTIITISADGLTKTIEADYDDNGTFEHKQVWKTNIDGSQSATITDSNASGVVTASGTFSISADQRTTSLFRDTDNDGVTDRSETSVRQIDGNVIRTITGSSGDDTLTGWDGEQILIGGGGADTLDGGEGMDIASFDGNLSEFEVTRQDGIIHVTRIADNSDADELSNIETLRFADGDVDLSSLFPGSGSATAQLWTGSTATGRVATAVSGTAYVIESGPSNGSVTVNSDGSYNFAPADGYSGTDNFVVKGTLANGMIDLITVNVTVATPVFVEGAETQVNTNTSGDQKESSVAGLSSGGHVVVWTDDDNQDGNRESIRGQIYGPNGVAIGSEFQVNTYFLEEQSDPSVASLIDGGFVVSWTSREQDGDRRGVYGQLYNSSGLAVGSEIAINTGVTSNDQYISSIAALTGGGFVVTWTDKSGSDGNRASVRGRVFNTSGVAIGSEFQINTYTSKDQNYSSVTGLLGGGFVVSWTSQNQDGSNFSIFGQRYDASGTAVGSEFAVNTGLTSGAQKFSSIASLSGGGFVVAWTDDDDADGDEDSIRGRIFDANGVEVGAEFQANTYSSDDQKLPSITGLIDGGFVVSWVSKNQDGSGEGVYGQRYSASGTVIGSEFQIHSNTSDHQNKVSIDALPQGGFVVSWTSAGQDGSGDGIYRKIYAQDDELLIGGAGADLLVGGGGADQLTGDAGADDIDGAYGDDLIEGGLGDDNLHASLGSDTYEFNVGFGQDTYYSDDTIGGSDQDDFSFLEGITKEDLWFSRSGESLFLQVLGTTDQIELTNWFDSDPNSSTPVTPIDEFLADGEVLDYTDVNSLVSAMAAFTPEDGSGNGGVTSTTLPQAVQVAVDAAWT